MSVETAHRWDSPDLIGAANFWLASCACLNSQPHTAVLRIVNKEGSTSSYRPVVASSSVMSVLRSCHTHMCAVEWAAWSHFFCNLDIHMSSDSSSSSSQSAEDIKYRSLLPRDSSLASVGFQLGTNVYHSDASSFLELSEDIGDEIDSVSYRYPKCYERWCMRISALCDAQAFADWNLEKLYRSYTFSYDLGRLSRFLVLFMLPFLVLGVLNFIALNWRLNLQNVSYLASAIVFSFLIIFINCRFMRPDYMMPCLMLVLLLAVWFAVVAVPVNWMAKPSAQERIFTLADGLWECVFLVLNLYLFFPCRIYLIVTISVLLSGAHTLVVGVLVYIRHHKEHDLESPEIMSLFWRMVRRNYICMFFSFVNWAICAERAGCQLHAQICVAARSQLCFAVRRQCHGNLRSPGARAHCAMYVFRDEGLHEALVGSEDRKQEISKLWVYGAFLNASRELHRRTHSQFLRCWKGNLSKSRAN